MKSDTTFLSTLTLLQYIQWWPLLKVHSSKQIGLPSFQWAAHKWIKRGKTIEMGNPWGRVTLFHVNGAVEERKSP